MMSPSQLRRLTLPLLLLVGFNVLPSIYLRPAWTTVFCAVLLAYRLWLHALDARMPPRLVLLAGQITVAVTIWQHYFTVFGDEAAGTLLTLLSCLKIFELRGKRDLYITVLLCFLVLMSALLLDQSLVMTVFLLADLLLLLTYLFALEQEDWSWSGWAQRIWPSIWLVLKSLPLMAVIFVLFPRFSTGFGAGAAVTGKMGITDQLKPGSIGNLISSDELVFRATFLDGDVPYPPSLYWRGAVLDRSNGLNWERSRGEKDWRPIAPSGSQDIEIYLEPGFEKFLFNLDGTNSLSFPKEKRLHGLPGDTFELDQPLQTRERYYLQRGAQAREDARDGDLKNHLEVREAPSAELKRLLSELKRPSVPATVTAVIEHLRVNNFAYSLQPPPAADLDDFLFRTKVGFCEHFAGATATLLRHLGVPSRVVVGFQGGTRSFLDNYVSVRAHDAHSWVEYFDPGDRRWRRLDPTMTVDPMRISTGSQTYLTKAKGWTGWIPFLDKGRALFDEIDASWTGFLLRFDLARQQELLAKLGMEGVLFRALPVFMILAIVLLLAILYYLEAQRRESLTDVESLYRQLLRALKGHDAEKQASEGPQQFFARLQATRPELAAEAEPILSELTRARFADQALGSGRRDLLRRRIRALRWRLPAALRNSSRKG